MNHTEPASLDPPLELSARETSSQELSPGHHSVLTIGELAD
jgi:hypothetical protein